MVLPQSSNCTSSAGNACGAAAFRLCIAEHGEPQEHFVWGGTRGHFVPFVVLVRQSAIASLSSQAQEPFMRLLPILAAAAIGVFAVTAVNAEGTSSQAGQGNPTGAQNMDTVNKGNPNTPSAGQTTGSSTKAMKKKRARKHHAM
jgi:hypothetical protein